MVGEKLGSFRIEGMLGVGAMGVVYKAVNESTGKAAAVKVIHAEAAARGKSHERFRREAEILQQFRHSNIVRFLALGRYKGTSYFAMEFIEGETLDDMLKGRGPLPWKEVVELGIQIADALHYAHEHGVVHRDLKPSNLMVTTDGKVKLTDFGIAKDLDATALTATGRTLGTAAYMAPEQIRGTPDVSHKTDLYALGIVFYQMLTGQPPFEGTSAVVLMHAHLNGPIPRPSAKVYEIPKPLDNLIVQLMAKEPSQRPWDAAAVSHSLGEILAKAERGEKVPMVWSTGEQADPKAATQTASQPEKKPGNKPRKKVRDAPPGPPGGMRRALETLGLVVALLAIVGFIVYQLRPLSAKQLFDRAETLMASENRHDWHTARDEFLDKLDKNYPDNPYKATTREWRDKILLTDTESRAKVLQSPVMIKLNEPATKNEERYVEYWLLISGKQKRFDDLSARLAYLEFAAPLDPNDPNDRGWLLLARKRIGDLDKSMSQRRETVMNLFARARKAIESGNPAEAESIRKDLVERFGQYTDLLDLLGPPSPSPAPAPPNEPAQPPPATPAPAPAG